MEDNSNRYSVDIENMMSDVFKRWFILLFAALITFMGAFVLFNETYTPSYKTDATFVITDKRASTNVITNLQTTTELATVLETVLGSPELSVKLCEALGTAKVPGTVSASVIPETNFITISVYSDAPDKSYNLFNTLMEVYPQFTETIIANAVITQFDKNTVATIPENRNNAILYALIATILVLAVVIFIICLFSFYKDTIKNSKEAGSKLNTKLYAVVPYEKKTKQGKNKGLLITDLVRSFSFNEAYKNIRAKIELETEKTGCKVIMITSTMENEGKTTVASNLALSLTQKDYKVLLLDADLKKPAIYKMFETDEADKHKFSRYLKGLLTEKEVITKSKIEGLDLVVETDQYDNSADLISGEKTEQLLKYARENYDYVIVDTPPFALKTDADELVDYMDASLIVVRQDFAVSKSIKHTVRSLKNGKAKMLGCVFNGASYSLGERLSSSTGGYYNYSYAYDSEIKKD